MDTQNRKNLIDGFETSFIDDGHKSYSNYRPEFVSNDYHQGKKVISALEQEMASCDEFIFSVAFISKDGIAPLLPSFDKLDKRGAKGKILTTDYQTFSDPKALDKLHEFKNIELKMYMTDGDKNGFHTKGYIFKQRDIYHIIVGSSNMTGRALAENKEWNTKLIGLDTGETIKDILDEFNALWNSSESLSYDEFINEYRQRYKIVEEQKRRAQQESEISFEQYTLQPNAMQTTFVQNLRDLRDRGETKGLLISATGTGKTYASAFGLRDMDPEKVLFVVHRECIARQAMESYKKVFGKCRKDGREYRYALLSGGTDPKYVADADLIFATMQTMCKDKSLHAFSPDYFTAICLDEAHHTGADSYTKIMEYFKPKFWLGMTASPDTDRFDVYEIFDHNIAYELRLQQALEENLLCPFHYFGIEEITVDGVVIGDEDKNNLENFNRLVCPNRVSHILKQADFYGHSGDRVKGLIFCSGTDEAKVLSKKFNEQGLKTVALTDKNSPKERENAIELLEKDVPEDGKDTENYLDYIFTVDIFSEGVDIPEVNQVIMLRPTQSAIVFVQQLGRGLRKAPNKEYVVVLDFIGNYNNNFLIPIALSGDRTYNKDNARRYVSEGDRVIPGISTIHFDEISRSRIYDAIDKIEKRTIKEIIKNSYTNLKQKLGRIPSISDFDKYGELDVCLIFNYHSYGSYYKFLVKYEKDYNVTLNPVQEKMVEFISKKLAPGKRPHELELLRILLDQDGGDVMSELKATLDRDYGIKMTELDCVNVANVMTNNFLSETDAKRYNDCVFIEQDNTGFHISETFARELEIGEFYNMVEELVEFGLSRNKRDFSERYNGTNFVLYQKYTYEDVCRLLGWEKNGVPLNIGGYKLDKKTKTYPIFINYNKSEDIADTIKYEDRFESRDTLMHISKAPRYIYSDDVQNMVHAEDRGIAVHLFIRKNKDVQKTKKVKDPEEFYYLGNIKATGEMNNTEVPDKKNTMQPAVEITWKLTSPVREDIYNYLLSE